MLEFVQNKYREQKMYQPGEATMISTYYA